MEEIKEITEINLEDIISDIVLSQPIMDPRTGALVLKAGTVLNKELKEKLKNRGITSIKIGNNEEIQDVKNDNIISEKLREKNVENLTKIQEEILHGGNTNMVNIMESAKKMTDLILKNNNSGTNLTSYIYNKDVNSHSERVSRYAVNLARIYNNERITEAKLKLKSNMRVEEIKEIADNLKTELIDLEALSVAALLHDIGINCKSKEVLEKIKTKKAVLEHLKSVYPAVDDSLFEKYREDFSSVYSYCLIVDIMFDNKKYKQRKAKIEFSNSIKRMVLYSNEGETSDKSPLNVSDELLKQRIGYIYGAKILHLCDIYDKALKNAIDRRAPFEEIVSQLGYYGQNGFVNNDLENLFINNFPFYPEGTLVSLSNGLNAVVSVERTGHTLACRPVVRLTDTLKPLDLAEDNSVTILNIIPNLKYWDDKEIFQNLINDQISALQKSKRIEKQKRKELYRRRGLA